jgi:limonene-1,2-epoxide hydrolase
VGQRPWRRRPSRVLHRRRRLPQHPFEPVTGRENIADNIASFIRPGPPGIERIEFRVINIAANGPVVLTERVDVFTLAGKTFDLQVMGAFEVNDGKIKAWRDYFDPSQFNS